MLFSFRVLAIIIGNVSLPFAFHGCSLTSMTLLCYGDHWGSAFCVDLATSMIVEHSTIMVGWVLGLSCFPSQPECTSLIVCLSIISFLDTSTMHVPVVSCEFNRRHAKINCYTFISSCLVVSIFSMFIELCPKSLLGNREKMDNIILYWILYCCLHISLGDEVLKTKALQ